MIGDDGDDGIVDIVSGFLVSGVHQAHGLAATTVVTCSDALVDWDRHRLNQSSLW